MNSGNLDMCRKNLYSYKHISGITYSEKEIFKIYETVILKFSDLFSFSFAEDNWLKFTRSYFNFPQKTCIPFCHFYISLRRNHRNILLRRFVAFFFVLPLTQNLIFNFCVVQFSVKKRIYVNNYFKIILQVLICTE